MANLVKTEVGRPASHPQGLDAGSPPQGRSPARPGGQTRERRRRIRPTALLGAVCHTVPIQKSACISNQLKMQNPGAASPRIEDPPSKSDLSEPAAHKPKSSRGPRREDPPQR